MLTVPSQMLFSLPHAPPNAGSGPSGRDPGLRIAFSTGFRTPTFDTEGSVMVLCARFGYTI